jgi:hypothetical protein
MARTVPWWVRGVVASDRALAEALALRAAARDAALLHLLDAESRAAVTAWLYAGQTTYLPGGGAYARGLFDWEREALGHLALAPGARVLVGGAGGGRELAALAAQGFTAVGFDPSYGLVAGAAGRLPRARRSCRATTRPCARPWRAAGVSSRDGGRGALGRRRVRLGEPVAPARRSVASEVVCRARAP